MSIMKTVRIVLTPEFKEFLDYLKTNQYPLLTYAEIIKVAICNLVVEIKRGTHELKNK